MVIVGAGQAGGRAALTLREAGHRGPILLLGQEPHAPYERPPLSKGFLAGDRDLASATIATDEALQAAGIDFRPSTIVTRIDVTDRMIAVQDGTLIAYDKLLLATGREPRRLAVPCAVDGLVHVLRDIEDCRRLQRVLRPGAHAAIVGGGFIGLEVAASARALGVDVTVIEVLPRLLARVVPAELADRVARRHQTAGVRLLLGRRIETISASAQGARLELEDGQMIDADAVLIGIGATPRTELAEAAGLAVDRGILVDERLRTSDPNIFAAGDVAACPNPLGGEPLRPESWQNAETQGALAARNMLGANERHAPLPWFWSDQYELSLQISGFPERAAKTVERPVGDEGCLIFHLAADDTLIGVSGLGPRSFIKEFKLGQKLLEHGSALDLKALAQPEVRLKSLLRA